MNSDASRAEQRRLVDAFLAAAREGDFEELVAVLDPDVVLRADRGALPVGARLPDLVRGATQVAEQLLTRAPRFARFARRAVVNGAAGLVIVPAHRPVAVVGFTIAKGRIVELDLIADPEKLHAVTVDDV